MLKMSSKRRRTQAQIREEKEAAAQKSAEEQVNLSQIQELQQQVLQLQQENEAGKVATSLMGQFIDSGLVNQEGNGEFTVQAQSSPSKFKAFQSE